MKTFKGSKGTAPLILNLDTRWKRVSTRPSLLNTEEITAGTQWTGGWAGPRAGLDFRRIENSLAPARNQTPYIKMDTGEKGCYGYSEPQWLKKAQKRQ